MIKNINPAFIEKDWYAVQVLKKVHEFSCPGFKIIFSGGTSLSKAHNIIQRFSEDVDFRVQSNLLEGKSKSAVIAHVRTEFDIADNKTAIYACFVIAIKREDRS